MAWIHGVIDRLSALVRHGQRDRDLAEEIRHHLELETERQRRRGHDDTAARAIALERFGNVMQVRDATRDARATFDLEGSLYDLRWAVRALRSHPGFTILALVTLALGVGATTAAFAVLETVLLRPLPYEAPERLVLMREQTAEGKRLVASYPNFADWRAQAKSFSGIASTSFAPSQTVTVGDEPVRATAVGVSRGFFSVFGVRPQLGREFSDAENAPGGPDLVMVSYAFWQRQMGGRTPLGTMRIGESAFTVIGVLPAGFRFIDDADLYFPHERGPGTVRNAHNYRVVGRLAPGVTLASARAEMATISRALAETYGDDTQAVNVAMEPLREYLVGDYRLMLVVVFGAAAMVLLIACTNLVSAQLARGFARQREVAVRAALGASRGRLARLLFAETATLVGAGAVIGVALAAFLTRMIRVLGVGLVPRLEELTLDGRVLAFVASVSVVAAIAAGLYPALRLAGGDPGDALRTARGSDAVIRRVVWRALVGIEVATAVVLLVGSALLTRTVYNIINADTGLDPRGVISVAMSPEGISPERRDRIGAELAALPGVDGVAFTTQLPFAWGNQSAPVRRPGDPVNADWRALAGFRVVTAGYFSVLRQPVVRGREFTNADRPGAPQVAVVTPGVAERLWPGEDPIGKLVATNFMPETWMTVVGVVREASSWSKPRGEQNEIYVPLAQHPTAEPARFQLIAMIRTSGRVDALVPTVRASLRSLVPASPARISTLEDRIRQSSADRRFAMFALTAFGAIALVLAGVGIYGVMSYMVVTRTREIGIRMALGAEPGAVRGEMLAAAASMALGGIVAGTIGGLLATRWLAASLYGLTARDPMAYAVAAVVLLVAALLGAYVPARRSSRVDPLLAIRAE